MLPFISISKLKFEILKNDFGHFFYLKRVIFFFGRDDSFHAHIEFLKSQGIAGISHHSLLFSKTEPVQEAPEHEVSR
jgi:hypothetical protein